MYFASRSQDITERKQVEVKAAGREQQLRQAQKMEAVGQLTVGVAHDFNNMLGVINGSLELVAEEIAQETVPRQELVESAIGAGQRGAELVRRLLAFAGQTPLKPEMTRMDKTILDTTSLLQHSLRGVIDVEVRLHSEAAVTLVDRNQLGNALVNLALNARDAMVDGGKLLIETSLRPAVLANEDNAAKWPTGKEVCIEVSDNGFGMAEDVREHAMEPFFTTKEDRNGSGLGLSMVCGFVQQSGGHITIDSEIGRGTKITIGLPRILSTEFTRDAPSSGPQLEFTYFVSDAE
jgi:signal transduction histidine kinase